MVALYVNSRIVCGFFLSWWGGPPQSCEHSIWDCVGFYTMHTFLDLSVERQFRIIFKSYNFLFGTTTTPSITFSISHFFSGQSWHASSSSIVLYLWLGAKRLTTQSYDSQWSFYLGWPMHLRETLPPRTFHMKLNGQTAVSTRCHTTSQHLLEKQVTSLCTYKNQNFNLVHK